MDKNEEHAIQTQQKFEFYMLGLVFTILGLSVQTAQFSSWAQSSLEIAAWGALLVSGLAGLSRMEWIPVSYVFHADDEVQKSLVREAKQGRSIMNTSGQVLSSEEVHERVKKAEGEIERRTATMARIDHKHKVKYSIHKWLFVVAIILLMVSRAMRLCSPIIDAGN